MTFLDILKGGWNGLLDLFFPPCCVLCGKLLEKEEQYLCADCLSKLPRTDTAEHRANRLEAFGWSDVGTWGSLYELSEKDTHGNVSLHSETMFYDANNNIVTLEKGKLAVIEGLEDYIVAESEGVLLICKKEHEQQIREMVADAEKRFEGKYN